MAQWAKVDRKQDSPIWAAAQVGKASTRLEANNLFNNTTADAYITGATVGTYGVSVAEMNDAAVGQVASVTVTTAGSGYTVRPTVTLTGGGISATGATATATGKVVTVTLGGGTGAGGQDYAVNDVVTINGGTGTSANVNVLTVNATGGVLTVSINAAGSYTALPTLANNNPTGGNGTSLRLNLSIGVNDVTVTANGTGYTSAPTVTFGGAGGSGSVGTAALRSEQSKVTSAGWVLRKSFGNRVQYETLVAMKSISSDASDDSKFPE